MKKLIALLLAVCMLLGLMTTAFAAAEKSNDIVILHTNDVHCGVSDGLGLGDNTKALLITRAMAETSRLAECLGGRKETLAGLAGMGDLIVTCTSMHSRNRRAGIAIGEGRTPQEVVADMGGVVEGYYAAVSAKELADSLGVEMPICEAMYDVLYNGAEVRGMVHRLMSRAPKRETDNGWV